MTEHPSFIQLDMFALGGCTNATSDAASATFGQISDHVVSCDQCKQHLASQQRIGQFPAALRNRAMGSRVGKNRARKRWLSWAGPLVLAGAAAAALLFFLSTSTSSSTNPTHPTDDYVGVKGGRTIGLYIKRGETVTLWNGHSSISEGDRLRLAIVSPGHTEVAVFTSVQRNGETRFDPIYHGELESFGPTLLTKAWQVDAEAGPELLLVVTSDSAIEAESLQAAFEQISRAAIDSSPINHHPVTTQSGQWIRPLVLTKEPTL